MNNYKNKYLKYKAKYLKIKKMLGGSDNENVLTPPPGETPGNPDNENVLTPSPGETPGNPDNENVLTPSPGETPENPDNENDKTNEEESVEEQPATEGQTLESIEKNTIEENDSLDKNKSKTTLIATGVTATLAAIIALVMAIK